MESSICQVQGTCLVGSTIFRIVECSNSTLNLVELRSWILSNADPRQTDILKLLASGRVLLFLSSFPSLHFRRLFLLFLFVVFPSFVVFLFVVFVSILHWFVQLYISTHKAPPTCSLWASMTSPSSKSKSSGVLSGDTRVPSIKNLKDSIDFPCLLQKASINLFMGVVFLILKKISAVPSLTFKLMCVLSGFSSFGCSDIGMEWSFVRLFWRGLLFISVCRLLVGQLLLEWWSWLGLFRNVFVKFSECVSFCLNRGFLLLRRFVVLLWTDEKSDSVCTGEAECSGILWPLLLITKWIGRFPFLQTISFFDYVFFWCVFFFGECLSLEMPILYSIANWETSLSIYRKTSFGSKKYILATHVRKLTRHSRSWLKELAEKKRDELLWLKMRRYQIFEIQPPHTPFRFKWPDSALCSFEWLNYHYVCSYVLFCFVL